VTSEGLNTVSCSPHPLSFTQRSPWSRTELLVGSLGSELSLFEPRGRRSAYCQLVPLPGGSSVPMVKNIIIERTDDLDGSPGASEVLFSLDGTAYTIDLTPQNQENFVKALQPYIDKATVVRPDRSTKSKVSAPPTPRARVPRGVTVSKTLFSQLSSEDKEAFRAATGITAPRIADAKVQSWLDAGKPAEWL
jgi:hypothetical protein